MKLVVFGLSMSSSWGNGHATLWRGLVRALARLGWTIDFFEKDQPYYASHRDLRSSDSAELILYSDWEDIAGVARRRLREASAAVVTSFCPDGPAAIEAVFESAALKLFYDLDTPVTLEAFASGRSVPYLGEHDLSGFDLALSYTGGPALEALRERLGAPRVAPLYGHVDPAVHAPGAAQPRYAGDLSYIGTYAQDRQAALDTLFLEPARRLPGRRFVLAGAQYPPDFPWTSNLYFVRHLPPGDHPDFYASSRLTLNVTRAAMAEMGWCPSGRLFEAAACGAALASDVWPGLSDFFQPGTEILEARTAEDVIDALSLSDAELARIAQAGRERVLSRHTAEHRAREFSQLVAQLAPTPAQV